MGKTSAQVLLLSYAQVLRIFLPTLSPFFHLYSFISFTSYRQRLLLGSYFLDRQSMSNQENAAVLWGMTALQFSTFPYTLLQQLKYIYEDNPPSRIHPKKAFLY